MERGLSSASLHLRWVQTIAGLQPHGLRVAFARAELYHRALDMVAGSLQALCARAEQAEPSAQEALGAFAPLAADPEHVERTGALRLRAVEHHLPALGRLLRAAASEHFRSPLLLDERSASSSLVGRDGRELSLGERRALARRQARAVLAKLLADPHPMVVRVLLANTRLTEDNVVTMAARRPAVAEVAVEIARLWSTRARVRLSLALNPGSPPAVVVPLLGLLSRPELQEVSRASDLPPLERAVALEHWELRPPPAGEPESALRH